MKADLERRHGQADTDEREHERPHPRAHRPLRLAPVLLLALSLLLPAHAARAQEPRFGPFGAPSSPVTADARPERHEKPAPPSSSPLRLSYLFYHAVVSPIDGPRCSHYPTCSAYALMAVRRRGLVGLLMTVDRVLMTNLSSPLRSLRLVKVHGVWRYYHPLDEALFLPVPKDQR